jgi:hypothetical protein
MIDRVSNPEGVPGEAMTTRDAGALVPIGPTTIGRDAGGRFAHGNPGGPGAIAHERTKRARALRQALHDAVTPEDLAAVARALVDRAKAGDVAAAKELLDRIIGRPLPAALPKDDDGEDKHVVIQLAFDDAG